MSLPVKDYPKLLTQEITDSYIRKNFESIRDFHSSQNQFLNFKFYEAVFSVAEANRKIPHGLGLRPLDIIVTKVTGKGVVTFNYGLFDTTNINVTVTGPCTVRFFAGVYWNYQGSAVPASTDILQYSSSLRPAPVKMTAVTANYTLDPLVDDGVIASKSPVTIWLPTAIGNEGKVFTVIKDDAIAANTVTVLPSQNQLISGSTKITLTNFKDSLQLYSAGVNGWKIINQYSTVSGASVSYPISIANGGSGQTTANAALNAFLPAQATNATKYLQTDGTNTSWATVSAAGSPNFVTKTAAYPAVINDYISASNSGASYAITLPTAVGVQGQSIWVYRSDSALSSPITIATTGGELINGLASGVVTVATKNEAYQFTSDNVGWRITSHTCATNWTSYTPTFVGLGTVTTVDAYWRREGPDLLVRISFIPGGSTAVLATISFPTGLTSISTISTIATEAGGYHYINVTGNGSGSVLNAPSATVFKFARDTSTQTALAAENGNTLIVAGNTMSFNARVPIATWQP